MEEKRTDLRFDVCFTARWQGFTAHQTSRISDLSYGGCYVDTIVRVTGGETLSLQILLPDGSWFELQGVVAHESPGLGFGVRFVNLNEEQHQQISRLLGGHEASPPDSVDASADHDRPKSLDQIDLTSPMVM